MIKLVIFIKAVKSWYTTSKGITVVYKNGQRHFWPYEKVSSFEINMVKEDPWCQVLEFHS